PSLDTYIVPKERIEDMIAFAKEHSKLENFDLEKFSSNAASREEISRVVVVRLGVSIPWPGRPKVDKSVGLKRLQVGALIGKAATGGALTVANLALGALAGLTALPAIVGPQGLPIALGVVSSAYTGLNTACDAVEKIAAIVRS